MPSRTASKRTLPSGQWRRPCICRAYTFEDFGQARAYDYTRAGNPTRELLADTLAQLEGGAGAVVVSSGMAAIDLALACLEPGDLIVAPHDCYAGTWRLLQERQVHGWDETKVLTF